MRAPKKPRPPKNGYVIVNADGLFGLYRTLKEAKEECSFLTDIPYRYTLNPLPKKPKRKK